MHISGLTCCKHPTSLLAHVSDKETPSSVALLLSCKGMVSTISCVQ